MEKKRRRMTKKRRRMRKKRRMTKKRRRMTKKRRWAGWIRRERAIRLHEGMSRHVMIRRDMGGGKGGERKIVVLIHHNVRSIHGDMIIPKAIVYQMVPIVLVVINLLLVIVIILIIVNIHTLLT